MATRYVTTQQYEPLRTPSTWTSEEKAMLQQLTDRFDDLYKRFGRLGFADLEPTMQTRIENVEGYSSQIDVIPGQITAAVSKAILESVNDSTGQQLVLSFSRGTILDKNNVTSIATAKIFENGLDITDTVPATAFRWERVSDDTAGDAIWNADAAHIGTKTVTLTGVDVYFRCVIRCYVDGVSILATASITNGDLYIIDGTDDTAADFSLNASGELIYSGDTTYNIIDGNLIAHTVTARFVGEITTSNLKTSFISIYPEGIDIFSDGTINLESGSKMTLKSGSDLELLAGGNINLRAGGNFNLRAGAGATSIGLSNNEASGYIQWAGAADPAAAPYSVKNDGSVTMTKLTMGNSSITNLTQMYAQTFADNADPLHAAVMEMYIPSEAIGVQSMKLSFIVEPYRAFSTTTGTIAAVEKTSTSGGDTAATTGQTTFYTGSTVYGTTTISGDALSSGESTGNTGTGGPVLTGALDQDQSGPWGDGTSGESTGSTGSGGTGSTGGPAGSSTTSGPSPTSSASADGSVGSHAHGLNSHSHGLGGHYHAGPSHTHSLNSHTHIIPQHTHLVAGHNHSITTHYHSLNSHLHSINHSHTLPGHYHEITHGHSISISGHTHKVTVDAHSHAITYGIFEGNTATSCAVTVDGTAIGSFASLNGTDITAYLTKVAGKITRDAWHTIRITPNGLTRIAAHAFIIMVVGSATSAIY